MAELAFTDGTVQLHFYSAIAFAAPCTPGLSAGLECGGFRGPGRLGRTQLRAPAGLDPEPVAAGVCH